MSVERSHNFWGQSVHPKMPGKHVMNWPPFADCVILLSKLLTLQLFLLEYLEL